MSVSFAVSSSIVQSPHQGENATVGKAMFVGAARMTCEHDTHPSQAQH